MSLSRKSGALVYLLSTASAPEAQREQQADNTVTIMKNFIFMISISSADLAEYLREEARVLPWCTSGSLLTYNEIIQPKEVFVIVEKIVVGQLGVNCYVVHDEGASEAAVIDPGDEFERIADLLDGKGLEPKYILFTHAHYDHVCAAGDLRGRYGASLVMHEDEKETYRRTKALCLSWGFEEEDFPDPQRLVRDGDKIVLGDTAFEVLHTPGHTPGSICLSGAGVLFTGDTLFKGSVGRTDLPGGDTSGLMQSLKRLVALPGNTKVYCGHGDETTIGGELRQNPFLSGRGLRFLR
jgi:glyoxylase-like metal-dependent hydrolase (beta-lactamase superfamily II)